MPRRRLDAVGAVLLVEVDDDLGVAVRARSGGPRRSSSRAQLAEVVDLAVEDDDDRAVLVEDRLVAGLEVDDAQALDAEADAAVAGAGRASRGRGARAPRTSARSSPGRRRAPSGAPVRRCRTSSHATLRQAAFSRGRAALSATFVWMPMQGRPDLSVIVVTHQGRDLALASCAPARPPPAPSTSSGWSSTAGRPTARRTRSSASSPHVTVIRRPNIGFAAANNVGLRVARGRYMLLLNPDLEIVEGTLAELVAEMDAASRGRHHQLDHALPRRRAADLDPPLPLARRASSARR